MSEIVANLAERKSINLVFGLINLAVAFVIVSGLWFVFLHPNGVMALYADVRVFSACCICRLNRADQQSYRFLPLCGTIAGNSTVGLVRTIAAVMTMLVLVYGFFWSFIGRFGITYFSPYSIIAAGGVGAEIFNARENASTAIVYLLTAFLWVALTWSAGFGQWPWVGLQRGRRHWRALASSGY